MKREREQLREELLAVLATSRELTAAHDDALADLILDRFGHPTPKTRPSLSVPQHSGALRADAAPLLITAAVASVLSLVIAMLSGASVENFLELWFLVLCVVCGVMQIGLYLGTTRVSDRPRRL